VKVRLHVEKRELLTTAIAARTRPLTPQRERPFITRRYEVTGPYWLSVGMPGRRRKTRTTILPNGTR